MPPWRLEEHPEAPGEWYYLNTETGETTWELPGDASDDAPDEGESGTSQGRPPAPPPPWKTLEHPDAPGEWYYLNEDTGETCWELPPGLSGRPRRGSSPDASGESTKSKHQEGDALGDLPAPWVRLEHPEGGFYYLNEDTEETTWEHPGGKGGSGTGGDADAAAGRGRRPAPDARGRRRAGAAGDDTPLPRRR